MTPEAGLLHVTLVAADVAETVAFCDAALGELGISRVTEFGDEEEEAPATEAVGYGVAGGEPRVWVVAGSPPTVGAHLTFAASGREQVDAFYAAALAAGARGVQAPRRWEIYRPGYYGAVVEGPGGIAFEAAAVD